MAVKARRVAEWGDEECTKSERMRPVWVKMPNIPSMIPGMWQMSVAIRIL